MRNIKKKDSFSEIAFMNAYSILISSMCLLSLTCNMLGNGLSSDIPDLSTQALESLVAHYDGQTGVETDGNSVISWTPVDANGDFLDDMIVLSTQRGNAGQELITYDGSGKLTFDDTSVGADGRYLEGTLSNSESEDFTVFWVGNYSADAPFATSGTYVYNIGPSNTSHQRDDGKGGFVVEQYNGTTYAGDDITAYDGVTTVWSTVITVDSHAFYANGENLNVGGTPSGNIQANASMIIGAYSSSGYDFVGEIEQLIIFGSALSDTDRKLIERYLGSTGVGLYSDIPGLSTQALESLVAHYDGKMGVESDGGSVVSWTPVDGYGDSLDEMIVRSTQIGNGAPELIKYGRPGKLIFDDTNVSADGRYLEGTLSNAKSKELTVFWLGHYKADAPFATSGTYVYNIGINNTSHQRDDGKGGFVVEQYNGTTYAGDDITAYDGVTTVWSTVLTADSHAFYANGENLNVAGTPSNNVQANASMIIGAYSSSGYDFVGEVEQLIIFGSALSDTDRKLVENYLLSFTPLADKPEISIEKGLDAVKINFSKNSYLLSSNDLIEWSIVPGANSGVSIPTGKDRVFYQAASEFREIPTGIVLRTKIESNTWREAQYHLDTGELFFIGEQTHGFDHYTTAGNDLWWCYMNTSNRGSGLIEFLMERNKNAESTKAKALENGWLAYTQSYYSFLEFKPLAAQNTYINHTAPDTIGETDTTVAYTADYDIIDNSEIFYVIYRNSNNSNIYAGVGGPSLNQVVDPLPPGDGSSNRDNGVRADIAFKAIIPLSDSDKLELFNKFPPQKAIYDDNSEAYYYVHPDGL